MKTKFITILLLLFTPVLLGSTIFKRIPECYLNFEGTENYILADSERKSWGTTSSTEFSIAEKKKVKINLIDTYKGTFKSPNGFTNLSIEIELSENKRFREYILAHYQLISEHHSQDHGENLEVEHFNIDSVDVYGFTANNINAQNLGNYAIFPSDRMAVYFRFMSHENPNLKSIQDFLPKRDSLIQAYLSHIADCENK